VIFLGEGEGEAGEAGRDLLTPNSELLKHSTLLTPKLLDSIKVNDVAGRV
jgi:hypothetical protein